MFCCTDMTSPRASPLHPDSGDLARQVPAALAGKLWLDRAGRGEMTVRKVVKGSVGEADAKKSCRPLKQFLDILRIVSTENIGIQTKRDKRKASDKNKFKKLSMKIIMGCLNFFSHGQALEEDYQASSSLNIYITQDHS